MPKMQLLRRVVLAIACMAVVASALAFTRAFPDSAIRGVLNGAAAPNIVIDDQLMQTTPATRIYNEKNLIVLPAYLRADSLVVYYTLNRVGQVDRIWILTDQEVADDSAPKKKVMLTQ